MGSENFVSGNWANGFGRIVWEGGGGQEAEGGLQGKRPRMRADLARIPSTLALICTKSAEGYWILAADFVPLRSQMRGRREFWEYWERF